MSDYAVVAFEPGDAARGETIVRALRDAGIEVRGDRPIESVDDTEASAVMGGAWVVAALWSRYSTARDGQQALFELAKEPADRGAYLGVLLDDAQVPFGFSGLDTVDMSKWSGGKGKPLEALVARIKRRFETLAPGTTGAVQEDPTVAAERRRRRLIVGGIVAALLILVGGGWYLLHRATPSPRQQIDAKLAAIPCSWLQVDPVDDGSKGLLAITGVADQPDRAGETIRGLVKNITVTTDRVARIGSNECPAIDVPRRLRQDDGGRMRIESSDVGRDKSMGLAETRLILNFKGSDKSMALFGIEPSGQVTWLLPDFNALKALKDAPVGFVQDNPRNYQFTLRADHLGWTGVLLVTGDGPLAANKPQYTVTGSHEFGDWLQSATSHGEWHTEMQWYRIQSR